MDSYTHQKVEAWCEKLRDYQPEPKKPHYFSGTELNLRHQAYLAEQLQKLRGY